MKILKKTLTFSIAAAVAALSVAPAVFADGSYSVDTSYIQLRPGETGRFTISADNAAGRVDWDSEGVVNESGSAFLDNGQQTIEFTAGEPGTAYITVYPDPEYGIATFDEEMIDYGYTIQVEVIDDSPNAAPAIEEESQVQEEVPQAPETEEAQENEEPLTTEAQEEQATEPQNIPAATGTVLTDGNNDYQDLSEEDRLYTTVDGQELYIIRYPLWIDEDGETVWNDEIFNLDLLNGFEYQTVNYKDLDVDTFIYDNSLRVFVLKNLETDVSQYYTLGSAGEGFRPLPYVTVNGRQYIVEEFPADFQIPEGYQKIDMTLGSSTVQALKPTGSVPSLRGYDVLVSPGLSTTDPTGDIYYIYCLVDGATQLYSYDAGEGTLQRASILAYNEIPVEPETVIVYETAPAQENTPAPAAVTDNSAVLKGTGWNGMQVQVKALLIALGVAIILIIILIIAFASMSHKNKKNKKNNKNNKNNRNNYNGRNQGGRDQIPPRTPRKEDDDSIFSYVKTEDEDF